MSSRELSETLATFESTVRHASRHAALLGAFEPLPQNCSGRVVFDIGTNAGADTRFFLSRGYCVVGVDANPEVLRQLRASLAGVRGGGGHVQERVRLINAGIDEKPGNLSFYVTKFEGSVHSSFELAKVIRHSRERAARHGRQNWRSTTFLGEQPGTRKTRKSFQDYFRTIRIPTIRCEGLWNLLPSPPAASVDDDAKALAGRGPRPYYLKIDIEERHFVCVEALRHVPRALLPRYVSWEMHEHARALPYPILDTRLLLLLHSLGYDAIKVLSNRLDAPANSARKAGAFSGGRMPDEVRDAVTRNASWLSLPAVLSRGLGFPRMRVPTPPQPAQHPHAPARAASSASNSTRKAVRGSGGDDWYDFYLRLGADAMRDDVEPPPMDLPEPSAKRAAEAVDARSADDLSAAEGDGLRTPQLVSLPTPGAAFGERGDDGAEGPPSHARERGHAHGASAVKKKKAKASAAAATPQQKEVEEGHVAEIPQKDLDHGAEAIVGR